MVPRALSLVRSTRYPRDSGGAKCLYVHVELHTHHPTNAINEEAGPTLMVTTPSAKKAIYADSVNDASRRIGGFDDPVCDDGLI
jgi:hypothetical protein